MSSSLLGDEDTRNVDPPTRGRPEASAAIWRWQAPPPAPAPTGPIRQGALLRGLVGLCAAAALYRFHSQTLAFVAAGISTTVALVGLASPRGLYPWIERGLSILALGVGKLVTLCVMVPIYYVVFAPVGMLFFRGGRDPLRRRFDAGAASYWKACEARARAQDQWERPY